LRRSWLGIASQATRPQEEPTVAEKIRMSFTKDQRQEAFENTDRHFRQKDLTERQSREEKTRRLRAARLAAGEQSDELS
jgi:hypothetical protein